MHCLPSRFCVIDTLAVCTLIPTSQATQESQLHYMGRISFHFQFHGHCGLFSGGTSLLRNGEHCKTELGLVDHKTWYHCWMEGPPLLTLLFLPLCILWRQWQYHAMAHLTTIGCSHTQGHSHRKVYVKWFSNRNVVAKGILPSSNHSLHTTPGRWQLGGDPVTTVARGGGGFPEKPPPTTNNWHPWICILRWHSQIYVKMFWLTPRGIRNQTFETEFFRIVKPSTVNTC